LIPITALLICGLLAYFGYGLYNSRRIGFRTLRAGRAVETTPEGVKELNILHLSDIHTTGTTGQRLAAIEAVSGKVWDFVFITGDLIDDDTGIEPVAGALGKLKAKYGKYAVLGNHDYFSFQPENILQWLEILWGNLARVSENGCKIPNDTARLQSSLDRIGVRILRNEVIEGRTDQGCPYQIFGIDDPTTDRDNPSALYDRKQGEALRLVLMHSPQRLESIRPLEPELIMCGHTHGGQIRVPFLGAISTRSDAPRRAASGLVSLAGCSLHISPGVGAGLNFPYRFNSPPEITELVIPQVVAAHNKQGGGN